MTTGLKWKQHEWKNKPLQIQLQLHTDAQTRKTIDISKLKNTESSHEKNGISWETSNDNYCNFCYSSNISSLFNYCKPHLPVVSTDWISVEVLNKCYLMQGHRKYQHKHADHIFIIWRTKLITTLMFNKLFSLAVSSVWYKLNVLNQKYAKLPRRWIKNVIFCTMVKIFTKWIK